MLRVLTLTLACACALFSGYSQGFEWADGSTTTNFSVKIAVATDDQSNSYVTGVYSNSLTIQGQTINTTGSSFLRDIYVAKYDSAGTLIWLKGYGGTSTDGVTNIEVDEQGYVYLSGTYTDSINLDGNILTTTVSFGSANFLARMNPSGVVQWAVDGGRFNASTSVTQGKFQHIRYRNGSVYFAATYFNEINQSFAGQPLPGTSTFGRNVFLVKLDTTGVLDWLVAPSSTSNDVFAKGVEVASNGDIFLGLNYEDSLNFGGINILPIAGGSSFFSDIAVMRFNNAGAAQAVFTTGGSSSDNLTAMTMDGSDNMHLLGNGTLNAGSFNITGQWLGKLTPGLTVTNAFTLPSFASLSATSIDSRWSDEVFFVGNYDGVVSVGPFSITGNEQGFFCAMDTAYNPQWLSTTVTPVTSFTFVIANDVSRTPSGQFHACGNLGNGTTFFGKTALNLTGTQEAFMTRLVKCSPLSVSVTPGSAVLCGSGGVVMLSAQTNPNNNLQWLQGGAVIPSANGITYTLSNSGSYSVEVDSLGCLDTSNVVVVGTGVSPTVSVVPTAQTVCINDPAFTLAGGSPAGGVWAGTGVVNDSIFDPAIASIGTQFLTYTYTNSSGCSASASRALTVQPLPSLFIFPVPSVCESDAPFALNGFPAGGTFSGPGVVGGSLFDPAQAGGGSHVVTYTYSDPFGCTNSITTTVTVTPSPTVSLAPINDVCQTTNFISLTGGSPFGGTYSGPFVIGNLFYPSFAGAGSYDIVYSITQSGCTARDTQTVQVDPIPNASLTAFADLCANDAAQVLTNGTPLGGTYFGTGIINDTVFDPAVSGVGTFTIGYIDSNACGADTATGPLTVNPVPVVTLAPFASVCVDDATFTLSGGSPAGGVYSGSGVVGGTQFDPSQANVGANTLTYTFTDGNGCTGSATATLTVNPLPVVNFTLVDSLCLNAGTLNLTGGTPAGGTYSGTGVAGTTFDPSVSGVGTFDVVYTYSDGNGCTASDTQSLVVYDPAPPVLAPLADVCVDASAFALSGGSPAGGTYSGPGVNMGMFDPAVAGVGTHSIVYTIATSCGPRSDTTSLTVNPLPSVSLTALPDVCVDAAAFALSGGSPAGGTYSGPGVSMGMFNPAVAGAGTHTITYTFVDANGCSASASQPLTVNPLPTVTLAAFADVCVNAGTVTLTGGSPAGGTYSGPGVSGGVFDPAAVGTGTYTIVYSFTDANGCSASATQSLTVTPIPTVSLATLPDFCVSDAPFTLVGGSPAGGTYSGPGVTAGVFDPSAVGPGTYTIAYGFAGANGCSDTATQSITVFALPTVALTPFSDVCIDAGIITLSGGSPAGGTYSGPGVSGGTFDPATVGVGTYTITYSFTDGNGCADSAAQTITVNPLPTVTQAPFSDVCVNAGTVTLSGGSPTGGTYSGPGVSAGVFDPAAVGVGTYTITYTYTDGNSCTDSASATITVQPAPVVTLMPLADVCIDVPAFALSGGMPMGGAYSGPGVSGGIFDPAVAGAGTHTITYTFTNGNGCTSSATQTLTVNPLPMATLGAFADVCVNASAFTLSGGMPMGGTYSGPGVSAGSFDPAVAGVGTHTITYTFSDGNGCADSASQSITVNPEPVLAWSLIDSVCITLDSLILSGATPAGGSYGGPGVSNGVFFPLVAGIGTSDLTYTYTDGNGCTSVFIEPMTVYDTLPPIQAPIAPVCANEPIFALTGGSPNIGNYSGPGVTNNMFDASAVGPGFHDIVYTITTSCGVKSDTVTVEVYAIPVVSMPFLNDLCIDASPITLPAATPAGGTYSGTGVTGSSFDPAVAGVGTHDVIYSFTNANGCTVSDTQSITVNPLPIVTLAALADICANATPITLTGGMPMGGNYSGPGVSAGVFDPSVPGAGSFDIVYTVTDANNCTASDTQTINVLAAPVVALAPPPVFCEADVPFSLSGGSPAGGTYSGPGVTAGVFDPAAVGPGTYTISYGFAGANGCSDTATQVLTVFALPTVTHTPFADVCVDAGPITLSGGTPTGGTYTGQGVSGGIFIPASVGPGTYTISYRVTNSNGCADSVVQTLTVNPLPIVTQTPFAALCIDASPLTLSGGLPAGGTYSGTGVSTGVFAPAIAGVGTFDIVYTYTDGNSCTASDTQSITVNPLPTVVLAAQPDACIDALPFPLTGGTPTGGTYSGPGVSGGIFNPQAAGVGTHMIVYTYTDGNSCTASDTQNLTVNSLPVVTWVLLPSVCEDQPAFTLSGGLPLGGVYSGPGVTGNTFDPAAAGLGPHPLTYTFTDVNGCTSSETNTLTVNALTPLTVIDTVQVCLDAAPVPMNTISPAGGTYVGPGINANILDPQASGAGTYPYTYIFTNADGCTSTAEDSLTVFALPVVSTTFPDTFCVGDGLQPLTGASPAGGVYAGPGVTGTDFDPGVTGSGVFPITYTYTDGNGCANVDSGAVRVGERPALSVTRDRERCGPGIFTLQASGASGYIWNTGDTLPGITVSVVQTDTFIVTGFDIPTCFSTDSVIVTINPTPAVNIGNDTSICKDQSLLLNAGSGFTSYLWSNGGTDSTRLVGPYANVGPVVYEVTVRDSNGCAGSDTLLVNVEDCITGIDDLNAWANIAVYPNPTTGVFQVSIESVRSGRIMARVFSPLGVLVEEQELWVEPGTRTYTFDASGFANGLYNVVLESEQGRVLKPLMINK